jgi:hypothetical protein
MTHHPAKAEGCTRAQIDAFNKIAAGDGNPSATKKTINVLLGKGLICMDRKTVGWDVFGQIEIATYFVPMRLHMQWCDWCCEQPEIAE